MIWLVMICAGVLTFAARYSMIGLVGSRELSQRLKRLLEYVAPAVLASIIAPEVMLVDSAITLTNPKIPAFILALGVALLTRNVLATIATGMATLWLLEGDILALL